MTAGKPRTAPPGHVRLIGGVWKKSRLPVAATSGLRPTPDRVRETVFNWLGQDLTGWRVLDAFAGSGALGFEAGSRGAADVLLLERDAALVASLRASQQRLHAQAVRVERADAMQWMARAAATAAASFDLVFVDPPFDSGLGAQAAAAAARLLGDKGFVYVEGASLSEPPGGFESWRSARAGAVHFQLLRRQPAVGIPAPP